MLNAIPSAAPFAATLFLSPLFLAPSVSATAAIATAVPAPIVRAQASAADEIAAGRKLLAIDPGRALTHFERAHELQQDFQSERWVLRAWIALGRTNDALDRAQEMETEGAPAALCSYLYGYSFAGKAAQHVAQGTGGFAAMNYGDAVVHFQAALEQDPETYSDAWAALADAAWWAAELDVARDAAERALQVSGAGPREQYLLGKVAFSQYSAAKPDEAEAEEAAAHWQAAFDAFGAVIDALPTPKEYADRTLVADAAVQRAYLLVWAERAAEAKDDYVLAMTYDPSKVDYGAAMGQLGDEGFLAALEAGAAGYERVYGAETQGDATLLWWLGFARNQAKDYAGAEEAMLAAVRKWPAYSNAWWTIATSRFSREDFDGAADALFRFQDLDAEALSATIQSNPRFNLAIVEGVVGHYATSYEATRDADKALRAARLALIQAAATPEHSAYWNNAGLFYRDAGDYMRLKKDEESEALRKQYHEASYISYSRALALEPDNPVYLNDTAVILHYCLDRDLDQALEMYRRATELAEEQLQRKDLSEGARAGIRIAHRDSQNNARLLEKKIEKREKAERKKREEEEAARKKEQEQGGDDGAGGGTGG